MSNGHVGTASEIDDLRLVRNPDTPFPAKAPQIKPMPLKSSNFLSGNPICAKWSGAEAICSFQVCCFDRMVNYKRAGICRIAFGVFALASS